MTPKHSTSSSSPRGKEAALLEGLVVRTEAGYHQVLVGDETIVSRAPKRLLRGERTATTAVVIGDHVRLSQRADGTGIIEEILPRHNELVRGAAGGSRFLDVIAANLDLLLVVHSFREPDFNGNRIDRFLLLAEAAEIPALLCLNKVDLIDRREALALAKPYEEAGYPVILTCARTGEGIEGFHQAVSGKISALVGPSGVGKSSLLNDIQPGLCLRTGETSTSTGKGRHTTTTAELVPLSTGGWLADTPGLRELAIREVEPEDLAWLFPEFRPYSPRCRFSDCTHRQEIGCAVREAVDQGALVRPRYESYLRVYEDLEAGQPF